MVPGPTWIRPLPKITEKITRNISGKIRVKNSDAGFRTNALLMDQTWRRARRRSLMPAHRRVWGPAGFPGKPLPAAARGTPRPPRAYVAPLTPWRAPHEADAGP